MGHLCLPLSGGILLGFFLADREWSFLPATAGIVASILIVGFVSIPLGRILQGAAFEDTRVRRIGRYLVNEQQQAAVEEKLEPEDIMLSRKNWYLSNVGLPGFWPHAIANQRERRVLTSPRATKRTDPQIRRAFARDPPWVGAFSMRSPSP